MKNIQKKWRIVWNIAYAELQSMFYSPVAWLTLIIFVVHASMGFLGRYGTYALRYELGYGPVDMTMGIFTSLSSLYNMIIPYLFYYFPLITMGLISKEFNKGSIKLLYSSPITNTQIIMGKYLSAVIYSLTFIAVIFIFILFSAATITNFDFVLSISGLLGMFLLMCAYAAIGLFMSSLVSYQIVAALGTFGILFFLNSAGALWQDVEFVRDITWWLSLGGRVNEFVVGLICSEEILYFIIVSALFLTLSILRLRANRQKIKWTKAWRGYVLTVLVACICGYITSRPTFMSFYDATRFKENTLTPKSQEILSKLDGDLTITTYVNILENNYRYGTPRSKNSDFDLFKKYWRFKPEMKFNYEYYFRKTYNPSLDKVFPNLDDKERMVELATRANMNPKMFKSPEEIESIIDLSDEQYRFVRQIEYENGEKTFLRIFSDILVHPGEGEISIALKRLVMDLPTVGFISSHGERDIHSYGDRGYALLATEKLFRYSLPNQGFDVEEVDLMKSVPEDINIIVIADVRDEYNQTEIKNFTDYVNRGGNLLIAGEVGRQKTMNPIVEQLGIEFMPGRLANTTEHYAPDFIISKVVPEGRKLSYPYGRLYRRPITMPSSVGIDYSKASDRGFKTTPIFTTDSTNLCWNEIQTVDFVNDKVEYNPELNEKKQVFTTCIGLERTINNKNQRIIVLSDSDCISNTEHNVRRKGLSAYNYAIVTGSFFWLSDGEAPIDIRRPRSIDTKMSIGTKAFKYVSILFQWVLPGILLLALIIIWIKIKNR